MRNSILKIAKKLIFAGLILVLIPAAFLLFIQLTDYLPPQESSLFMNEFVAGPISNQSSFSVSSWNLGYSGLGKEMDFFHEGGKQVRPPQELAQKYLNKNLEFIHSHANIDFWFFQEVDKKSKRSYYVDQSHKINNLLNNYCSAFSLNYKVPFIPIPLTKPMGSVNAGMMIFSKFLSSEHKRVSYPNIASWPEKLFLLDRCFVLFRHPLPSGKDLVMINTHNSYYVSGDSLRMIELNILKNKMIKEYEKGNYVVVGGDWNKYPPLFKDVSKIPHSLMQNDVHCLDANYLPLDWTFAYNDSIPTNRAMKTAYVEGKTKLAVIDFFVVSPNVKIERFQVFSLKFENSDHNPIKLDFSLIHE